VTLVRGRRRRTSALAVVLWAASIGLLCATGVVIAGGGRYGDRLDLASISVLLFVLACSSVGALVAARRPGLPIGWLLLAAGVGYAFAGFATSAIHMVHSPHSVFLYLAVLAGWVWGASLAVEVVLLLLRFPDGRLLSRRWRVLEWAAIGSIVAFAIGITVKPGRIDQTRFQNPLAIAGPVGRALGSLSALFVVTVVTLVFAMVSVVIRYRRSRGVERGQIKWILYAVIVVALAVLGQVPIGAFVHDPQTATDLQNVISTLAISFLPVAIGIAVLRYRLWDIDRLINRTIVYALLTVLLVGVYAGLVVGLGTITGRTGNPVLIAGSTLVVAALFGPARRRIQALIDRRFYRRRYDAERVLGAFSARLRDELDIEQVRAGLVSAVGQSVQPSTTSLWLRAEAGPE
jgi:hypothetical protein